MEFWHFANNCSLPRTILYSLLVSSAWVLVQKLHMRSTIVLEQDKYWRSLREISPPKISAFSTFLLCLLSIYIYYSGICLHRFELKVLHTLQNCPLVSYVFLILLEVPYDRSNCSIQQKLCVFGPPSSHLPPLVCYCRCS